MEKSTQKWRIVSRFHGTTTKWCARNQNEWSILCSFSFFTQHTHTHTHTMRERRTKDCYAMWLEKKREKINRRKECYINRNNKWYGNNEIHTIRMICVKREATKKKQLVRQLSQQYKDGWKNSKYASLLLF